MKRGEIVTAAFSGDYGKPRQALVVQDDAFSELPSVTVLPLTSDLHDWPQFRVTVAPSVDNGLRKVSQVMVDKTLTIPRQKVQQRIGHLDAATMTVVGATLARFLSIAD